MKKWMSMLLLLTIVACAIPTVGFAEENRDTLSIWCPIDYRAASYVKTLAEVETWKVYMDAVNVDVEFIHPPQGMEAEQFMVLLTSRDLPDIIIYNWYDQYPGGPDTAISDEVIVDLTPYINETTTPNLMKVFEEYPSLVQSTKTASGKYYVFPCVRAFATQVSKGIGLRGDWLEELNLEIPVTMDDWHEVLVAFRDEKGCTAPLTFINQHFIESQAFCGAFGIGRKFYVDTEGVVQYGPAQEGYGEFLKTMAQWYSEGLIDKDFASTDASALNQNVTSEKSGAFLGVIDSQLGSLTTAFDNLNPDARIVGAPYPVLNEGDPIRIFNFDYEYTTTNCAAITTSCENVDAAVRFLDYAYSDAGHMLVNFGVEGLNYEIVDGEVVFTDYMTNNPDGITLKEMIMLYCPAGGTWPLVRDVRLMNLQRDERVVSASALWSDVSTRDAMVPLFAFSEEDNGRISKIMSDVYDYVDTMTLKYIMGQEDLSTLDEYFATIEDMNIAEVLDIYNRYYQEYLAAQ